MYIFMCIFSFFMYCVVYMYLGFKQPLLDIFNVNTVGFYYILYMQTSMMVTL